MWFPYYIINAQAESSKMVPIVDTKLYRIQFVYQFKWNEYRIYRSLACALCPRKLDIVNMSNKWETILPVFPTNKFAMLFANVHKNYGLKSLNLQLNVVVLPCLHVHIHSTKKTKRLQNLHFNASKLHFLLRNYVRTSFWGCMFLITCSTSSSDLLCRLMENCEKLSVCWGFLPFCLM